MVDSGYYSPETLAMRRQLAAAMLQRGSDTSPIGSPWQGVGRLANAMMGGWQLYRQDQREQERRAAADAALLAALGPGAPGGAAIGGGMAADQPARPGFAVGSYGPEMSDGVDPWQGMKPYADAIAGIESDGSGGYGAIGPDTGSGDRAYGRYQVMGSNVGPWTKQYAGQEMTPDEFIASPAAQDQVFRGRFGGYMDQTGNPNDAASMWFTGRPLAQGANAQDMLGTTGAGYVQKFQDALGAAPQAQPGPAQAAQPARYASPQQVPAQTKQMIAALLSNPETAPLARAWIMQHMLPPDPAQQADIDYKRAQIEALGRKDQVTDLDRANTDLARARAEEARGKVGQGPAHVQEYEYYRKQAEAAGQTPKTFEQWSTDMRKSGAAQVTIDTKGDTEFAKELGKGYAKQFFDMRDQAANARESMALYDQAAAALESGVRTGTGGEAENALRRFGVTVLGIGDAEKLAAGELVTAVQNRLALLMRNPDSGMGMPGAVSDRDLTFLRESQPGLGRGPESNRVMIEAARRLAQRKIDLFDMAAAYVQENGRLDAGFDRQVRQFADANPLFADRLNLGGAPAAPAAGRATAAPAQPAAPQAQSRLPPNVTPQDMIDDARNAVAAGYSRKDATDVLRKYGVEIPEDLR